MTSLPAGSDSEGNERWLIRYDDTDRHDELFAGHGSTDAAIARFSQVLSRGWNCYLFKCVADAERHIPFIATPSASPPAVGETPRAFKSLCDNLRETASRAMDREDLVTRGDCLVAALIIDKLERELAEAKSRIAELKMYHRSLLNQLEMPHDKG